MDAANITYVDTEPNSLFTEIVVPVCLISAVAFAALRRAGLHDYSYAWTPAFIGVAVGAMGLEYLLFGTPAKQ